MKAAVYDNPGVPAVLEYVDVPDPTCGPGDVLIAVEAISIEGGDLIFSSLRSVKPLERRSLEWCWTPAVASPLSELSQ